jgi:hypothetical protein
MADDVGANTLDATARYEQSVRTADIERADERESCRRGGTSLRTAASREWT